MLSLREKTPRKIAKLTCYIPRFPPAILLPSKTIFDRRKMPAPAYDIFKKGDAELIWVETAQDLQSAKTRIEELARQNRCEYVVYDQRAKRIVASHG
jgi:hypothetical protein